jgi:radical SAM superfamily enzyme with C-terminal helix-hairpin-helix motif
MRRSEKGRCKARCSGRCSLCCNHALQRPANRAQVVENIGVLHAALQCAAVRCAAAPPFRGCSSAAAQRR